MSEGELIDSSSFTVWDVQFYSEQEGRWIVSSKNKDDEDEAMGVAVDLAKTYRKVRLIEVYTIRELLIAWEQDI